MTLLHNGCCNNITPKTDPLIHVLLHGAPHSLDVVLNENHQAFTWRRILVRACEDIRGRKYNWIPRKDIDHIQQKAVDKFLLWGHQHKPLRLWAKSNHSFVAPTRWPSRVAAAFAPFPVPSPYRFANTDFGRLGTSYRNHDVMSLMAYASGIRVRTLAEWYQQQPNVVVYEMAQGVKTMLKDSRFKVWLVNLDWSRISPPTSLGQGLLSRMSNAVRLKHNPLLVAPQTARALTNSPQFVAWACSKQARKSDPMRIPEGRRIFCVAPPGTLI